jgi:hypothetical protein
VHFDPATVQRRTDVRTDGAGAENRNSHKGPCLPVLYTAYSRPGGECGQDHTSRKSSVDSDESAVAQQ